MGYTLARARWTTAAAVAALAALTATLVPGQDGAATLADVELPRVVAAVPVTDVDPLVGQTLATETTADVIVRIGSATNVVAVGDAIASTGGEVTLPLPIIDGMAAKVTSATVEALRALGVASISYDGEVQLAHGDGTTAVEPDTTVRATIGANRLHRSGYTGKGVGIATIDTGATNVGDIKGRVAKGVDLTADADGVDRFGHGTFVAGVAAGSKYGIAPGAHIVPVKIAGADGSSDVSHVLAALQWVVSFKDHYDIGVVNLSLGTDSTQHWTIDPMNYAVQRAWDAGIVVVVSASNRGPEAGTVTKPADDPWVITVGATDGNGTTDRADDIVAAFSGRGPTVSGGLAKPDLVAPGAHLLGVRAAGSTIDANNPQARYGDGYLQGSGTSFAAGVVSGAVAVLRQAQPTWTPNQIKGALLASAAAGPVGDPNVDGEGAIDVLAASKLTNPSPANQGLARSDGSGTLAASRGTLEVAITDTVEQVVETTTCVTDLLGVLICTVEETVETTETLLRVLDSTSEYTAQNQLFDAGAFVADPWTATSWADSQWYGLQWYGLQWYGLQWYGLQWYGLQWYNHTYG